MPVLTVPQADGFSHLSRPQGAAQQPGVQLAVHSQDVQGVKGELARLLQ